MKRHPDIIVPLTNRTQVAAPAPRDRVGQRVQDHFAQASQAIRSVLRASTTRPLTMPTAPTKRR